MTVYNVDESTLNDFRELMDLTTHCLREYDGQLPDHLFECLETTEGTVRQFLNNAEPVDSENYRERGHDEPINV